MTKAETRVFESDFEEFFLFLWEAAREKSHRGRQEC